MSLDFRTLATEIERFNSITWWVAQAGQWLVIAAVAWSVVVPYIWANSRHRPRPTTSMRWRSAGSALQLSSILVALCTLLHFLDLRWLPPGFFNSVLNVPAELRAATTAVNIAVSYSVLALIGWAMAALSRRAARKAETQQFLQAAVSQAVEQAIGPLVTRIADLENQQSPGQARG